MLKSITFLFLVLAALFGCSRGEVVDIHGAWTIREDSREVLPKELQKVSARIVLESGGNFEAFDVPGLLHISEKGIRLESGRGTWKLVSREGRQQVQLNFLVVSGDQPISVPYGVQLNVQTGSSVRLFYSIGDPDAVHTVEFERH